MYGPVRLFSVVIKAFEKLINNRLAVPLEKCGLFSDFQYGFRSSRSTVRLLTVILDRIARVLIILDLLKLWHLIYPGLLAGFACWSSSQI